MCINNLKKVPVLFAAALLLPFSLTANDDFGFGVKCYVQLSNEKHVVHVTWTRDKTRTPAFYLANLNGKPFQYKSAKFNTKIIKTKECRYEDELFVNVDAIRLDEARYK